MHPWLDGEGGRALYARVMDEGGGESVNTDNVQGFTLNVIVH